MEYAEKETLHSSAEDKVIGVGTTYGESSSAASILRGTRRK